MRCSRLRSLLSCVYRWYNERGRAYLCLVSVCESARQSSDNDKNVHERVCVCLCVVWSVLKWESVCSFNRFVAMSTASVWAPMVNGAHRTTFSHNIFHTVRLSSKIYRSFSFGYRNKFVYFFVDMYIDSFDHFVSLCIENENIRVNVLVFIHMWMYWIFRRHSTDDHCLYDNLYEKKWFHWRKTTVFWAKCSEDTLVYFDHQVLISLNIWDNDKTNAYREPLNAI